MKYVNTALSFISNMWTPFTLFSNTKTLIISNMC